MSISETRDAFGPLLEKLQADMREVKDALRLMAATIPGQVQVMILDLQRDILAHHERMEARLDQTERSIEERLGRIEMLLLRRPDDR